MRDKKLVAPSMLAADFGNLARDIDMVNQSDADWFHLKEKMIHPDLSMAY